MGSYKFLAHGCFFELSLVFLSFSNEVVDEAVDFLPIMLADVTETHHIYVEYNAGYYGCDCKHQIYCQLSIVYLYFLIHSISICLYLSILG